MSVHRTEKLEQEFAHIIAAFINEISNRTSLITVTHAELSSDQKRATIFISVLPHEETEAALIFLDRNKNEARDYIKTHIRTRAIPFLRFLPDLGEENRQKIDELSRKI